MINITIHRKDGGQDLYPNRIAPPAFSGDYCVLQGAGLMNIIPLSEIDYITHESQESEPKQ